MTRFHLSYPLLLALVACTGEKIPPLDDTGNDSDSAVDTGDSNTDTGDSTVDTGDSTTDSNTDTGDSNTDTGDTGVVVNNLLLNPGFELGNDGSWLIYPTNLMNYSYEATGNALYQSSETFTAYVGSQSLKVYGQYTGGANETPVYQEFPATAGEIYTFSGYAWMHHDDPLTQAHTYLVLSLKYFDNNYSFLGTSDSAPLTNLSAADTWTELKVTGTVPPGATKVQAAIEYWQCVGNNTDCFNGNGGVYLDEMVLTLDGTAVDTGDTGTVDTGDTGTVDTGTVDTGDTGTTSSADPAYPLYFSGSTLSNTAGASTSVVIPATSTSSVDVVPADPALLTVLTASGLNGSYNGGSTSFSIALDGDTGYGQATQAQFDYDFDGDGVVDRSERYTYFATDAATGWESYTEASGLSSESGSWADFVNGSVTVTLWKAFQADPTFNVAYDESQSSLTLPYGATGPSLSLANGDFEAGNDGSWLVYPSYLSNFAYETTGNAIYNSADLFTAYDGITSLKVYGQWTTAENETPIYQEFSANAGEVYTLSGYAWMHHDDALTAAHTYAYLSLKYFDNSYNYYGSDDSMLFDYTQPSDTWTLLSVTGTVPVGATKVQAAIEFWQCKGQSSGCVDGNGSVYFDDLVLQ